LAIWQNYEKYLERKDDKELIKEIDKDIKLLLYNKRNMIKSLFIFKGIYKSITHNITMVAK
jgi:hypothetical protein